MREILNQNLRKIELDQKYELDVWFCNDEVGKGFDLVLFLYFSVGFIYQKKKKKEDYLDLYIIYEVFLNGK